MARSRNIKPGFFQNDMLAENHPLGRLLFLGLWTIADYQGNLEYRPKRIKASLLPYDDCNIEELTINLEQSGFITIYSVLEQPYIHVNNFSKHQNPHKNEISKGSFIPEPPTVIPKKQPQDIDSNKLTNNHDQSRLKPEDSQSNPADSGFLIPDSGFLNTQETSGAGAPDPQKKPKNNKHNFSQQDLETAQWVFHKIQQINPNHREPSFKNWANEIRKIREIDKHTDQEIRELFHWANQDDFWGTNILSPSKLRKQWDQLTIKKNKNGSGFKKPLSAVDRVKAKNEPKNDKPKPPIDGDFDHVD
ncbi:MAG: hypothetical protein V3U02_06325 [Calditrichia bacterium]